jgi:hypothetical protein
MIRKEFECRRNGILSLELAHRVADSADEARMLKLAQDWLDLANLIHRQSGQRVRKIGEHPLAWISTATDSTNDRLTQGIHSTQEFLAMR